MIAQINHSSRPGYGRQASTWIRGATALAATLLCLLCLPIAVQSAEWVAPPGIDIATQERVLKERVTQHARSRIGKDLIEVIVHVRYVRLGDGPSVEGAERIKLPGFSSYIVGSDNPEVMPEFMRIRQIFVVADETMRHRPGPLARDIAAGAGLEADKGDTIRVITVARGEKSNLSKIDDSAREKEFEEESAAPIREANEGLLAAKEEPPPDPLKEAQSTVYLMKARRSYFTGDFQTALDQILQAISVNPRSAQAYSMLGSLYYAMNWKNLAIKYWERSLEIDPTNREIEDLVTQIRVGGL